MPFSKDISLKVLQQMPFLASMLHGETDHCSQLYF